MADTARQTVIAAATDSPDMSSGGSMLRALLTVIALEIAALAGALALLYQSAFVDTGTGEAVSIVSESTLGQLGLWMAEQSALDAPESLLGQLAKSWAASIGQASLDAGTALHLSRLMIVALAAVAAVAAAAGASGLWRGATWTRRALLAALIGFLALLFIVPPVEDSPAQPLVLASIFQLLILLLAAPGRVTKFLGFMVVLAALLLTWEAFKAFSAAIDYQVALPQGAWTYQTYPTQDEALVALQNGDIPALIIDENDVEDMIPAHPGGETDDLPYPDLRILSAIETQTAGLAGLPIQPSFPGRLAVVTRAADAGQGTSVSQFARQTVGTVAGSFADERFLREPRRLVLLDLKIGNDLNLPHLQSIAEALLQPARRQGPLLLARILGNSALFTWGEAAFGFAFGALFGFLLGTLFAHSRLMERGLLPYVVASQTVPILAIAPMVVIWLGSDNPLSVAMISAYLTFFPVTINTLRGLTSPAPTALELMRSYAASKWTVMWKLRFPAALPYIFTALKVSATASVVGAIIGELPSGIQEGLGRAILNFNQYYASDPAKLWAAIFIAALVGIAFFLLVSLVEWIVLRGKVVEG